MCVGRGIFATTTAIYTCVLHNYSYSNFYPCSEMIL